MRVFHPCQNNRTSDGGRVPYPHVSRLPTFLQRLQRTRRGREEEQKEEEGKKRKKYPYRRRMHLQSRKPLLQAIVSVIIVVSMLIGCSASDAHGEAAVSRTERGLEMKCTCNPCGYPCDYSSPPPPPPSPPPPPPPAPYFPPQPFCPPPPMPLRPPPSSWPPYYWLGSPGKLYPVDPGYFPSEARRSCMGLFPALVAIALPVMWL
ncbi:hypothetical protein BHM03_00059152 [Ensete ventricosum]|nr:hypothetical protein BHM03_00059152 [Ensete ventricosum]